MEKRTRAFVIREVGLYTSSMMPAVFLDRDGVIIENRDEYVRSWDDVYIYPQALQALAAFSNVPFHFIIITSVFARWT